MFKKSLISLCVVNSLFLTAASALTLKESVVGVLETSPIVQERLKNYRVTQQDLGIAESEYYPSVDLRVAAGHTEAGNLKENNDRDFRHSVNNVAYATYESSLTFTQNIFDGFGTMHKVDYEEARILAAAYKYLEVANDTAFKMTGAYIDVLRSKELIQTARDNVQINETIYEKVSDLFEAGLTTDSEVKKIQSTLSLARSNLIVQINNARDFEYKFRRIFGRLPEVGTFEKPDFDVQLPESRERAGLYAIENNPTIIVSRYNIKGAQSLYKQRKKEYYPKIDFEASQSYNDNDEANNGFDNADDRFKAQVILTYNLFRGGADKAEVQKNVSKINQEIEIQRDKRRQIIEGLDLSWNANEMLEKQLVDLNDYSRYAEKTLELMKEEYDLGRRSLLDLLSAQNDVINSRSEIIKAEYDQLFAKYRILDAMGLLVVSVNGSANEFSSKVNLYGDDEAHEVLDTIPVILDSDNDKIADDIDLCANSLNENNIMPYGCKKDYVEEIAELKKAETFVLDCDNDGVIDAKDECPTTPAGYNVDAVGCSVSTTMRINFANDSSVIPDSATVMIDEFRDFLNENSKYKVNIVGHTSSPGKKAYNQSLSERRAASLKASLASKGIDETRMTSEGRGELEPVADNGTRVGRKDNRRVEIEIIKEFD